MSHPLLRARALLLAAAVCAPAPVASAKPLGEGGVALSARTDVPVLVGLSAAVEGPHRLRGQLSLGVMPGPYVDLTNTALTGFEVYSENVATIIDAALRRSLVTRVEGGWRPLPERGLVVLGGYQLLALGGDTTGLSAFGEAMDGRLLSAAQDVTGDIEVGVSAHQLTAGAGWEWSPAPRLHVGANLGFAGTVATRSMARTTREARNAVGQTISDDVTTGVASYLDYVFDEWVHLPMVGVSVGWRLK